MDDVLTLLEMQIAKDERGVEKEELVPRVVFCKVEAISRAEYFNAGRNGLNPSFEFLVFAGDYHGETECIFKDRSYSIYRTYLRGDEMELYAERKGGSNGRN